MAAPQLALAGSRGSDVATAISALLARVKAKQSSKAKASDSRIRDSRITLRLGPYGWWDRERQARQAIFPSAHAEQQRLRTACDLICPNHVLHRAVKQKHILGK